MSNPLLVSPAEPPTLSAIGTVSPLPERFGCDFLWRGWDQVLCGIQRKKFPDDLVASAADGRLERCITAMSRLNALAGFAGFVLEGHGDWHGDKLLGYGCEGWTRGRLDSLIISIQVRWGMPVWWTDDMDHTVLLLSRLQAWTNKDPGAVAGGGGRPREKNAWGVSAADEDKIHLLQGLPGCGRKRASGIVERFGLPWRWTVGEEELATVPRVSKKLARRWIGVFGNE